MPFYDLEEVKKVASNTSNIFYNSRKVRNDIENLNYTEYDVSHCICSLTPEHFYKQESYGNDIYLDAYKIKYTRILDYERIQDDLYIKFRLTSEGKIAVTLASFHLSS